MRAGPYRPVILEGALALECGWDPLHYLSLEGVDRLVAKEILQAAADKKAEHDKNYWKSMQAAVGNAIVRAFKGGG